jgi:hypothetical protein
MTLLNDGVVNRSTWTSVTGMDATTSLNMLQEICSLEERKWKVKVLDLEYSKFAKRLD